MKKLNRHSGPHGHTRQRGIALILVMLALSVAMLLALTFMARMSTSVAIAENIRDQPKARQIAETGLALGIFEISNNPDWRTDHVEGTWVNSEAFGGGTFSVAVQDGEDLDGDGVIDATEGDGDLADDAADRVTITAVGSYRNLSHRVAAVLNPASPGAGALLVVLPNAAAPTALQSKHLALLGSWGFAVTTISQTEGMPQLLAAAAAADVVYVTGDCDGGILGTKLRKAAVSVVVEDGRFDLLDDSFDMAGSTNADFDANVRIINNTHYITDGLPIGVAPVFTASGVLWGPGSGNVGPGYEYLVLENGGSDRQLGYYSPGVEMRGNFIAPARRIHLPWRGDSLDMDKLTPLGQRLMQRSLEWGVAGGPGAHVGLDSALPSGAFQQVGNVQGKQFAVKVTLPEPGTLTAFGLYMDGIPPKDIRKALYTDLGGEPGSLILETRRYPTRENQWAWVGTAAEETHLAAGDYWIAFAFEQGNMKFKRKTVAGGGQYRRIDHNAISNGFALIWGVSEFAAAWEVPVFMTVMYDSQSGPSVSGDDKPTVRWLEQP